MLQGFEQPGPLVRHGEPNMAQRSDPSLAQQRPSSHRACTPLREQSAVRRPTLVQLMSHTIGVMEVGGGGGGGGGAGATPGHRPSIASRPPQKGLNWPEPDGGGGGGGGGGGAAVGNDIEPEDPESVQAPSWIFWRIQSR